MAEDTKFNLIEEGDWRGKERKEIDVPEKEVKIYGKRTGEKGEMVRKRKEKEKRMKEGNLPFKDAETRIQNNSTTLTKLIVNKEKRRFIHPLKPKEEEKDKKEKKNRKEK